MGKKMDVKTVQGAVMNVITKSDAMIANSNVETADFEACNGAVHIMDKVIQPPGLCVFNSRLFTWLPKFGTVECRQLQIYRRAGLP